MKRILLLFASAALLFAGCQKEQIAGNTSDGEMVNVTFSAQVQGEESTRAAIDGDGKGVYANRCIMALYYGNNLYGRYEAAVSNYTATFDVKLPAKRTYKAVFWADCAAQGGGDLYYNTADLKNITIITPYFGNDDKRDAFFAAKDYTIAAQTTNGFTATLKRPFAQINVISKDIQALHLAELYPQKVNLKFAAPTSFNAMSGECGAAEAINYEADVYKAYDSSKEKLTLSMDYLFAGSRAAVDIEFSAPTEGTMNIEYSFTNIPYERNYRTNIIGNLLTADAHWEVTIAPAWDQPDEIVNYFEAGSIAAANEALKSNNAVSIENPSDFGTAIVIPTEQDGKDVLIKITGASTGDLVINNQTEGAANLNLESDSKNLTINTPKTHVDLNKGNYESVTATTSATTLVVGKDVEIEALTINGGNVEIYGKVTSAFTRANGVKATMYASDPVTLANYISWAKSGEVVYLDCDIDLEGVNWTPLCASNFFAATFDGQNHTISNLKVTDYTGGYIGFISVVSGGTIKNVTFKDAVLTNAESLGGNARGAVVAGWSYACKIDNCHVINSSVSGCQKVAGILGSMSVEGSVGLNSVTNCSVDGLTLSCNIDNDLFQAGALIGYIQLINANPDGILVENNSVKNVTFNRDCSDYGNVGYYNGTFIGTISRKQKVDGQKIVLNNNTIAGTNTEVFKTIYSSPYFGWTNNAEEYNGALAPILIDGVEWTPNYPFKNVTTGTGYPTLNAALAALQQGETLEIWQAGEYAVNSINTPENTTIDAKVDGVIFNHTSGSVSSHDKEGRTIKNITLNVGVAAEQFLHIANVINCTFNGLFYPHGTVAFTGCTFNAPGYEYCMWTKGSDVTFKSCTFNTKGKAINVYGTGSHTYEFEDCVFNATEIPSGKGKAAIFIKEGVDWACTYNVIIKNCQANYERPYDQLDQDDVSYSQSVLWNIERGGLADQSSVTVNIDGIQVYPFCSKDSEGNYHIVNADGLLQFHDLYTNGKVAYTAKVYVENDIDFTGKTWDACEWHADGAFKGFALFDGQNHTIKNFTVNGQGMFSRWAGGATPCFKDIVFDGAKNVTSTLNVSLFCGQVYQNAQIENVTIKNSQFEGTYKVAPFVGTVYDERSGNTVTLTLKDCKVEKTTVRGTSYDFDICGMVAWVNELGDNDRIAFEGNNVIKDVTLYTPGVTYGMCAKIYHNGETAYNEATNVTVTNVNIVNGQ